jgi:hypothetical protein
VRATVLVMLGASNFDGSVLKLTCFMAGGAATVTTTEPVYRCAG